MALSITKADVLSFAPCQCDSIARIDNIQSILLQRMIGNVIGTIQQAIHSGTLTTVADVAAAAAAAFAIQQANLGG